MTEKFDPRERQLVLNKHEVDALIEALSNGPRGLWTMELWPLPGVDHKDYETTAEDFIAKLRVFRSGFSEDGSSS